MTGQEGNFTCFMVWILWAALFSWHPLIGLGFLPTAIAAHRLHRQFAWVCLLNMLTFFLPIVIILGFYATLSPTGRERRTIFSLRRQS